MIEISQVSSRFRCSLRSIELVVLFACAQWLVLAGGKDMSNAELHDIWIYDVDSQAWGQLTTALQVTTSAASSTNRAPIPPEDTTRKN